MAFLNSSDIKVYPSGYRGNGVNPESFVNSEQNLNEIASRLTSKESYISKEDGTDIEFVVKGYLFKSSKSSITASFNASASEGDIIYASVKIHAESSTIGGTFDTLIPYDSVSAGQLDVGTDFKGIDFSTSNSTGALALYEYDGSKWIVVEDSKMIFSSRIIEDDGSGNCISDSFTTTDLTTTNLTTTNLTATNLNTTRINVTGNSADVSLPDSSIDTNEIANNAVTKDKLNINVFDIIYPVGSIYMSVNSTNPANLFGGTWEQIQGQFLIGAGTTPGTQNTYTVNTSGGQSLYTFTIGEANLPQHRHYYNITTAAKSVAVGGQSFSGTTDLESPSSSHMHFVAHEYVHAGFHDLGSDDCQYLVRRANATTYGDIWGTGGNQSRHNHTFSGSTAAKSVAVGGQSATGYTDYQKASNITFPILVPTMPPYLVVYMWKRTAL